MITIYLGVKLGILRGKKSSTREKVSAHEVTIPSVYGHYNDKEHDHD